MHPSPVLAISVGAKAAMDVCEPPAGTIIQRHLAADDFVAAWGAEEKVVGSSLEQDPTNGHQVSYYAYYACQIGPAVPCSCLVMGMEKNSR
jgi:hypothetical protein